MNRVLQFLGFGWEYYYLIIKSEFRGRKINTTKDYRINKYTGKIYKRRIFSESWYGHQNWSQIKCVPKNLIKVS